MDDDEAENGDNDGDLMPETPAAATATATSASPPFLLLRDLVPLPRRKRTLLVANLRHASPPISRKSENIEEQEADFSNGLSPRIRNGDTCTDDDDCNSPSPRSLSGVIRSVPTGICAGASPRRRKWRSVQDTEKVRTRVMRAVTPNFLGPPPASTISSASGPPQLAPPPSFSPSLSHVAPFAPIGLSEHRPPPLTLHHQQHQQHQHLCMNQPQTPAQSLVLDRFETKSHRLCSPGTTWETETVASTTPNAQLEEPDSTTHPAVKSEPVSFLPDSLHVLHLHCYAVSPAASTSPAGQLHPASFSGSPAASHLPGAASYSSFPAYAPASAAFGPEALPGFAGRPPTVSAAGTYHLESSRMDVATTLASSSTSCLSAASSSTSPNGAGVGAVAIAAASSSARPSGGGESAVERGRAGGVGRRAQPEAELSIYKNKMENVRCGVCADTAAGFHCGAYVCEACKKFYIRSHKADNANRYQCTKMGQCEVSKDTRTHCQYCRYKKCEILGMYPPGSKPNESSDISVIPCRVCGAQSSGFHFGAITCEGCKGFFRRTINERESNRYQCSKGGCCDITVHTRNNCKSCRYMKCLAVGMSKTGSRIGRQPNAIKHMCAKEIEAIQSRYAFSMSRSTAAPPTPMDSCGPDLGILSSAPTPPQAPKLSPSLSVSSPAGGVGGGSSGGNGLAPIHSPGLDLKTEVTQRPEDASMRLFPEERLLRMSQNLRILRDHGEMVVRAAEFLKMVGHRDPNMSRMLHHGMHKTEVWSLMMTHFDLHATQVAQFALNVPGFMELDKPDTIILVQEAMYPIILIMLGQSFDTTTGQYNYFNFTPEERDIIMNHFSSFKKICDHLSVSGNFIQQCAFDETATALLCSIHLTKDSAVIENRTEANNLHLRCIGALEVYLSERSEAVSRLQLSQMNYLEEMLTQMNIEHHNIILELKGEHPDLVFPKLFVEMFNLQDASAVAAMASSSSYANFHETRSVPNLLPQIQQQQQQQQLQAAVTLDPHQHQQFQLQSEHLHLQPHQQLEQQQQQQHQG